MPDMTNSVRRVRVAFNAPPKKEAFDGIRKSVFSLKCVTLILKFVRKKCLVVRGSHKKDCCQQPEQKVSKSSESSNSKDDLLRLRFLKSCLRDFSKHQSPAIKVLWVEFTSRQLHEMNSCTDNSGFKLSTKLS